MSRNRGKLYNIYSNDQKVIIYCPRCTTRKLVRLSDYPHLTLDDIHLHMPCPGCGFLGVDYYELQEPKAVK